MSEIIKRNCIGCGGPFTRKIPKPGFKRDSGKYCSLPCYRLNSRGILRYNYIPTPVTTDGGYVSIWTKTGRRKEHILIAEKVLGRRLKPREVVHHLNGDKTDNRNTNLLICTNSYHKWLHNEMSRRYMTDHFPAIN